MAEHKSPSTSGSSSEAVTNNVRVEVELGKPIALEDNSRFAIREGGKTVGSGVVTKILQ